MDESAKKDYLEKSLQRLLSWIVAVELRLTFLLTISLAMLSVLAGIAPKPFILCGFASINGIIAAILLLFSIFFAALATFPRTTGPAGSLIFFGELSALSFDDYRNKVSELNDAQYIDDLVAQCHRNAQIARIKFSHIKRSLVAVFFSAPFWLLSVYFHYGS